MTAAKRKSAGRPGAAEAVLLAAACGALAHGAWRLAEELTAPPPSSPPARAAALAAPPPSGAAPAGAPAAAAAPWPALFGRAEEAQEVPEPPPPEETEAEEEPPEEAWDETWDEPAPLTDYVVKGVIAHEGGGWILVEIEGEERVVRIGDTLPGGERVLALTPEGALIEDPYGGPPMLLAPEPDALE